MPAIFVTGTDTGVGKTVVCSLILSALKQADHRGPVAYFKPVQTGTDGDLPEVIRLASLTPDEAIEPVYRYAECMAPARAAALRGETIRLESIAERFAAVACGSRIVVVEGAGGILVPLNPDEDMRDLVQVLRIPVLLVVSTRLGTINHCLLSIEAIRKAGLELTGIVLVGAKDPGLAELIEARGQVHVLANVPMLPELSPGAIQELAKDIFGEDRIRALFPPPLGERDAVSLWHPYTQHGRGDPISLVRRARGAWIELEDGTRLLDAISSWWVNLHGHARPEIVEAIRAQAETLEHVLFAGYTHEPAIELAERLLEGARSRGMEAARVFYSDNGSTAVETALKMAYLFHLNRGDSRRTRYLALRGSFHGDTLGAMSVCEPQGFHERFRKLLPEVDFVDPDNPEGLEVLLNKYPGSHAAFIFEPHVQAAAGMRLLDDAFLKHAAQTCREKGVLLIADEVFTAFYRTGRLFAFEHSGVLPDLLCLAKGLTGGFLPLAATLATSEIFDSFASQDLRQAFLHGHSFTANPLGCAAALASWRILGSQACQERIEAITRNTQQWIGRLANGPRIRSARAIGTIGALDLMADGDYFTTKSSGIRQFAASRGVLLRPLGNTIYVVPPYCCTDEEIDTIYHTIEEALA